MGDEPFDLDGHLRWIRQNRIGGVALVALLFVFGVVAALVVLGVAVMLGGDARALIN